MENKELIWALEVAEFTQEYGGEYNSISLPIARSAFATLLNEVLKYGKIKKCDRCGKYHEIKRKDTKYCKECANEVKKNQSKNAWERIKADPERLAKRRELSKLRMREIRKREE